MANIASYYISSKNKLISDKDDYITGNKYRFTVLTPRLIRLEYSPSGKFVDEASALVVNRAFPKCLYSLTESDTMVQIATSIFTVTYVKNKDFKANNFSSNLKAIINNTNISWQMNSSQTKNLRGINYSFDNGSDKVILDTGLYSLDGYAVINDNTDILTDNGFIKREPGSRDIYLFMYNKDFDGCLNDYYTLTGYPSLIPRYALGAWWYKNDNYTVNDIIALVDKFNKNNIPLSIFLLGDTYRGDNKYLPSIDLKTISSFLKQNNIKLGISIDPSLKMNKGSNEYNYLYNYINDSSFIPLNENKLNIYISLINNISSLGVDIYNIDYNDKNNKIDLWKLVHYEQGRMILSGKRGLTLSRNYGIAVHRYPIIYTGETKVNWNTLNMLPRYNLQGYNVGAGFIAYPVGGFKDGTEDGELYLRYLQFACFSPIFLLASEGGKYYKREPWKWNPMLRDVIISFMNLRYRIIPYLYTESYNYHITGKSICKPFYFDYPKILDDDLYNNQYFFGSSFFVAPITNKKNNIIDRVIKKVFIPEGLWFNFLDGKQYTGNKYYVNFYRDSDYPVFVKAGSIIPMTNCFKENIPTTLELSIYPLCDGSYDLYEDDGTSNSYNNGLYMITSFSYKYSPNNYSINITKKDGRNLLSKRNYIIRFKNTKNINNVNISDTSIKYKCYYDRNDFIIVIDNQIVGRSIDINISGNDILVSSIRIINEDIREILYDLPINTRLKDKLDEIIFSDIDVKKKRIKIRKLKRQGLDNKYIKIFINLLEYIQKI